MKRIIARLDIKGENVIKGIHLEGLKIVGKPELLSEKYLMNGADEIYFHDTVASLYRRNNLFDIVEKISGNLNIPLTVSGGLRSVNDIEKALISGADKVSLNTIFHENLSLISEIVKIFGSQAIVGSIEAKKLKNDWIAFTDNGRTNTERNVVDWIKKIQDEGVGEILITSVDFEGTQKGFDLELIKKINTIIKVPLILSGGVGSINDIEEIFKFSCSSGVAVSSILHFNKVSIKDIKKKIGEKINISTFNLKKQNKKITVLESKICNLKSLTNSLAKIAEVNLAKEFDPKNVDRLVIPGVGSFSQFSKQITDEQKNSIIEFSNLGKPILGICLGAQFLFTKSHEHGEYKGLNLIEGEVVSIGELEKSKKITIPNIGWYEIESHKDSLFLDIPDSQKYYFIHSYNFDPKNKKHIVSKIKDYNINAICRKNNIVACQFHPEKSGIMGIKFLENFINNI